MDEVKFVEPLGRPVQLTTRKLNGKNYQQWSTVVQMALTGYEKEYQLFEEGPPPVDPGSRKWMAVDAHIVSLLWNSMEPNIANMCMHLRTCKAIWNVLREIYLSDITRMYDVFKKFFHLKQDTMTMTEYYGAFKRADEELKTLMLLTADLNRMRKQCEFSVLQFLARMKSELEPIRAQILGGVTLPTVAKAYS